MWFIWRASFTMEGVAVSPYLWDSRVILAMEPHWQEGVWVMAHWNCLTMRRWTYPFAIQLTAEHLSPVSWSVHRLGSSACFLLVSLSQLLETANLKLYLSSVPRKGDQHCVSTFLSGRTSTFGKLAKHMAKFSPEAT